MSTTNDDDNARGGKKEGTDKTFPSSKDKICIICASRGVVGHYGTMVCDQCGHIKPGFCGPPTPIYSYRQLTTEQWKEVEAEEEERRLNGNYEE